MKMSFQTYTDICIGRFQMSEIEYGDKLQMILHLVDILKKEGNAEQMADMYRSLQSIMFSCIEEIKGKYNKRRLNEALNYGIGLSESLSDFLGPANPINLKLKKLIGYIFCAMQKYDAALRFHDEVYQKRLQYFGEDNRKTLNSLMNKAYVLLQKCEFEKAWNIYDEVYQKRRFVLGPFHKKTLHSLKGLFHIQSELGAFKTACQCFKKIYHIQRLKGYKQEEWNTAKDLANLYFKQRKYGKALEIWTKVYSLESQSNCDHSQILITRSNIAKVLAEEGKYEEAIRIYNEILPMQKSSDIPEHAMNTENNIAMILTKQKEYSSAMEIFSKLSSESVRILGPEQSTTLSIQNNVGALLCSQGCFDEALTIYSKVQAAKERNLGFYHLDTLKATCSIARVYVYQGKYDEALRLYNEARDLMHAILLPEHIDRLSVNTEIAEVYINQGKYDKAFEIYYDLYERKSAIYGVDHRYASEIKEKMRHIAPEKQMLIKATQEADLDRVKSCLENGDNINVRDIRGCTPLHIASENGYGEVLKLLLKDGAIYEMKNMERKTPADIASNGEVKNLLHTVRRLFSLVKINDSAQVTEILEQEKAIINVKDKYGYTPLHWASHLGYANIVRLLLDIGVNHKAVSREGSTALHHAAFGSHNEIIVILLDHVRECDPDQFYEFLNVKTTSGGITALHLVARKNNYLAFKLLLKNGANPYIRDKLKRTPSDESECSEILKLLGC